MADETGAGGNENGVADTSKTGEATQKAGDTTTQTPDPSAVVRHETFGELEKDTAEWLAKRGDIKDVKSLAKIARDKDSMVGTQAAQLAKAIIPPGDKATPEEIKAYREKMGMGLSADDYTFELPKDLPEGLPYDGDRAKSFAGLANDIGLSKTQAQKVHDWALKNGVDDFNGSQAAENERKVALAKSETDKLTKLYGPINGEQFRATAAFADKALELGGPEVLQDLLDHGDIVEVNGQKIVQRASMFTFLAKVGQSLYKEGDVVRGNPSSLDNPFMDGEQENITMQGRILSSDRPRALALIAAAGKKPSDFGLTG